jgi:alkanesulfonate monooxygenase
VGGVDLSSYPLDGPLPDLPDTELAKSRLKLVTDLAQRENLTIRELYLAIAGARGHRTILGTPQQIADQLKIGLSTVEQMDLTSCRLIAGWFG